MNKVTTINLGGTAYQLEEPGYDKLRAYLNDATAKLGNNPDKDEIILDLERAIAEKCDTYLTRGKNVVSTNEVEQIITDMGPVHAAEGGEAAPHDAPSDSVKRLYRVHEHAWIFGVCSGLAAYFNVDVALVRIIAVLLLVVTHGGAVFGYILAAIFIPRANTPEKRAAAYGVPFSTQDFMNQIYNLSDEVKAQSREWKSYRRSMKRDYRAGAGIYYGYPKEWRGGPLSWLVRFILELLVIWFVGWLLYTYVPTAHDFMTMAWAQIQQQIAMHR
ncbi:MAG TPA: PspC domain-containing protein [Candidatus Paceibacterota bacterium]|jgi:phage shock protein PspC (stress-responsive transcriptional regulator)|nr:PspC domain-containing protein [Candidatus Paceibacterota bacterium]